MEYLNPPGWPRPHGYANGVAADGRLVFVAGQIGWDETGTLRRRRARRPGALARSRTASPWSPRRAGGPSTSTRMTWFVVDKRRLRSPSAPRSARPTATLMGGAYPAMSLYQVGLLEPGALVEIEVTAVVPE